MPGGLRQGPKITVPVQIVLQVFLEDITAARYGLEIGRDAGLASGTVHPILARLEAAGWLTSQWEVLDPSEEGRPRRRYYELTRDGAELARNAVARREASLSAVARLRSPMGAHRRASEG